MKAKKILCEPIQTPIFCKFFSRKLRYFYKIEEIYSDIFAKYRNKTYHYPIILSESGRCLTLFF